MKKLAALLLVLVLVFSFAACGQTPDAGGENGGDSAAKDEPGYSFTVKGVKVEMGVLAKDVIDALGEPAQYNESASCAFEGLDKTYGYGGYIITTYPDGDKDYILSARFVDDSVTTEEGIYIGSTKADVEKAYGADCFEDDSTASLKKGNTELLIFLEDGAVVEIQYQAIVD